MPKVQDITPRGEIRPQFKHGDIDVIHDKTCIRTAPALAGEQFYRLTEQGAYRILEENLDLRILEEAP